MSIKPTRCTPYTDTILYDNYVSKAGDKKENQCTANITWLLESKTHIHIHPLSPFLPLSPHFVEASSATSFPTPPKFVSALLKYYLYRTIH